MSLDECIAGPHGEHDWIVVDSATEMTDYLTNGGRIEVAHGRAFKRR